VPGIHDYLYLSQLIILELSLAASERVLQILKINPPRLIPEGILKNNFNISAKL
jgi:hypothetical protein